MHLTYSTMLCYLLLATYVLLAKYRERCHIHLKVGVDNMGLCLFCNYSTVQ
jgi:hypothetical protein